MEDSRLEPTDGEAWVGLTLKCLLCVYYVMVINRVLHLCREHGHVRGPEVIEGIIISK